LKQIALLWKPNKHNVMAILLIYDYIHFVLQNLPKQRKRRIIPQKATLKYHLFGNKTTKLAYKISHAFSNIKIEVAIISNKLLRMLVSWSRKLCNPNFSLFTAHNKQK